MIASAIKGGSDRGQGAGSPGVGGTDPAGEAAARTADQGDLAAIAERRGRRLRRWTSAARAWSRTAAASSTWPVRRNEVPLPLLFALILLGLFAFASGLAAMRERVPALARIPLLSKIPTPRVPFFQRRR